MCIVGGRCFTWGKGEWGALGHGDLVTDLYQPKQIPSLEGVKSVSAGDFHSVIVTSMCLLSLLSLLSLFGTVIDLTLCDLIGLMMVAADGTPYVMGDGKYHQLGTTGKEWKMMKRKLPVSKPLDVSTHAPDDLVGARAGQACTFIHDGMCSLLDLNDINIPHI
jgi:alpha-tubulin suppressor-like RCC1 family protein